MGVEMTAGMAVKVVVSLCCVGVCSLGLYLYHVLWLQPERVRGELRRQGIGGPRPSFPYGNLADMRQAAAAAKSTSGLSSSQPDVDNIVHDYRPAVFPFYEKWRKEYGWPIRLVHELAITLCNTTLKSSSGGGEKETGGNWQGDGSSGHVRIRRETRHSKN